MSILGKRIEPDVLESNQQSDVAQQYLAEQLRVQAQNEQFHNASRVPNVRDNTDFFLMRLDATSIIDQISHQLSGEVLKVRNGKYTYIKQNEPLCNDDGKNVIMNLLYSFLNHNMFLSNFNHDEIYVKCNSLWKELAYILCTNYVKFDIPKYSRSYIVKIIINQIHGGLARAELGFEADLISTQIMRVENSNNRIDNTQQQSGIFSFMRGKR